MQKLPGVGKIHFSFWIRLFSEPAPHSELLSERMRADWDWTPLLLEQLIGIPTHSYWRQVPGLAFLACGFGGKYFLFERVSFWMHRLLLPLIDGLVQVDWHPDSDFLLLFQHLQQHWKTDQ